MMFTGLTKFPSTMTQPSWQHGDEMDFWKLLKYQVGDKILCRSAVVIASKLCVCALNLCTPKEHYFSHDQAQNYQGKNSNSTTIWTIPYPYSLMVWLVKRSYFWSEKCFHWHMQLHRNKVKTEQSSKLSLWTKLRLPLSLGSSCLWVKKKRKQLQVQTQLHNKTLDFLRKEHTLFLKGL